MQIFKRIDKFTFLLSKYAWEEEDRFTSKCIGLEEVDEFSFKGDVRKIWPEALKNYLELIFRELYMPERKSYHEAVKLQLNEMYAYINARFKQNVVPRIDYSRPLMKHQLDAIKLTIQHKHTLLSLSMGLGKSIVTATVSKILDCKRTIIIAPAGVIWNWFDDMCNQWGYDPINWTMLNAVKSRCQFAFLEKFVVLNYENVNKYFDYLTLRPVDHIIIDECFPYHTLVKTDIGDLFIGDIVHKKINCNVLSCDLSTNELSFQKIEAHSVKQRKTEYIKISHSRGEIICTRNHKIYVEDHGFKRADEILAGDKLRELQGGFPDKIQGEKSNSKILFPKMQYGHKKERSGLEEEVGSRLKKNTSQKNIKLRSVPERISRGSIFKKKVLWTFLRRHMEIFESGNTSEKETEINTRKVVSNNKIKSYKKPSNSFELLKKDEGKKSNEHAGYKGENDIIIEGKNFSIQRRQRTIDKTTNSIARGNWTTYGICDNHGICEKFISEPPKPLQSRFSASRNKNSHRSRWSNTQIKEVEISRQEKDRGFKCVRVESVEILESGSGREFTNVYGEDYVYNIQVANNRNYFASNVLVSNCHMLKNPNTARTLAVKKLIDHFPDARVTMLTGTPVTNRINDMFSYYKLFGHLLGKNKSYFDRRYLQKSNGYKGKVVGANNIPELRVRHGNFVIRKTAEECLDLPPLIINKYYMDETEMSKEYVETLKKMYQNRMALEEAQENKSIKQLEGEISSNVHSLNRILATSKVTKVIELIDKLWEEGRKVIVFSGYSAPLELLEAHYADKCVKIDGSVDTYKRSQLIEKYKTKKNCHVFLGNVKAAGVGINLVNSNHVIFMNFPFTPDDIEQPYKRAHRIGQNSTVNVYFTIVKNSIDEHIYNIIIDKSRDINSLIDKGKKGVLNYESGVMNLVFNKLLDNYAKEHGLPALKQQLTEV